MTDTITLAEHQRLVREAVEAERERCAGVAKAKADIAAVEFGNEPDIRVRHFRIGLSMAAREIAAEILAHPEHDCGATNCRHASDCAVHNPPAYAAGPCDCGVAEFEQGANP